MREKVGLLKENVEIHASLNFRN